MAITGTLRTRRLREGQLSFDRPRQAPIADRLVHWIEPRWGFVTHALADRDYAFPLVGFSGPVATAPLLCAGLIGWRSLAGQGRRIGLCGLAAAAYIIAQVRRWQCRDFLCFKQSDDKLARAQALSPGAGWAGGSPDAPRELLDVAIVFAPVGAPVLRSVRKGSRVVGGGILKSDMPAFPCRLLWEKRRVRSVAKLKKRDAVEFPQVAPQAGVLTTANVYPLKAANEALTYLRAGRLHGAAVLLPGWLIGSRRAASAMQLAGLDVRLSGPMNCTMKRML
ncbi:MAG: alcohol dehydrogenase [Reyranella sp.]|nr:alcohol dehydrogenase [Reyranella sp.]